MNNNGLKTVLYTFLAIAAVVLCVSLFISILPYLLIGGTVIWLVYKLYKFFFEKNNEENTSYYSSSSYTNEKVDKEDPLDDKPKEVIDVDYKEVK